MLEQFAHAVQGVVADLGYPGLFALIVLESTMIPIPSMLVMPFAGYLASQGTFSLPVILVLNALAALTGSLISYAIGAIGGNSLLTRYGKYFFVRQKDLEKTQSYFQRYGGRTVFIARFLPVVRHLISIPAGIARMPLWRFAALTVAGASLWGGGLMVVGYELGSQWDVIEHKAKRIDLVLALVIVVAILAIAARFILKRRRERSMIQTPKP